MSRHLPGPPLAGRAQVLLVDDDERLLTSLARVLRGLPVEVSTATSGEAALAWLERGGSPAVVVTDQVMAGMTGLELLHHVEQLSPAALRMLYTGIAELHLAVTPGLAITLIAKPAAPKLIRRWVYAALWAHD